MRVRACVRACVRVRARVCVCACACVHELTSSKLLLQEGVRRLALFWTLHLIHTVEISQHVICKPQNATTTSTTIAAAADTQPHHLASEKRQAVVQLWLGSLSHCFVCVFFSPAVASLHVLCVPPQAAPLCNVHVAATAAHGRATGRRIKSPETRAHKRHARLSCWVS